MSKNTISMINAMRRSTQSRLYLENSQPERNWERINSKPQVIAFIWCKHVDMVSDGCQWVMIWSMASLNNRDNLIRQDCNDANSTWLLNFASATLCWQIIIFSLPCNQRPQVFMPLIIQSTPIHFAPFREYKTMFCPKYTLQFKR